jgi:hypothetical protein
MITNTLYSPAYLQGAYNPIVWSILSDKITETDFKYVFDIYVNGVGQVTLKQRPNPVGAGMIDIGTLIQGYLTAGPPNGPWTQGETTINPAVGHAYQSNGTLSLHVYIKAGEEYTNEQGETFVYNGVTDEPGSPAYGLYSNSAAYSGNLPVHVWPSSVEYQLQQWGMSNQTAYSGAYGKNPVDEKNYDWGNAVYVYSQTAYPLNYLPEVSSSLQTEMYAFDRSVLSFINWTPYPDNDNLQNIYAFRFTFRNEAGTVENELYLPVYTGSGCGPRTTCSQNIVTKQLAAEFDLIHVIAGPDQVAELMQYWNPVVVPYVPVPGHTLEIQGYNNPDNDPFDCNTNIPVTKQVKIKILENCANPLYPRVRLSWLNDLGGRDYMNFTSFLEKDVSTTNDTYSQEQINWGSTTPVPVGVLDPSQYLMLQGGTKVYNKMANTSWSIQTDWLNQEQADLLQGLQKSPQVFAYIHKNGNDFSDYTPYPVTITESSYKVKNVRQTKLVQGEFTIALTVPQKLQNT